LRTFGAKAVRRLTIAAVAVLGVEVAALGLDLALPPDLDRARASSAVVLDRNGVWLRALPVEQGRWRIRADLDRTDPVFVQRLLAMEDSRFYLHHGVDPLAVVRAALSDVRAGEIVSGGSTLTMQVARRLEQRPRTFGAKLVEAARALQLEARLSKREILALYLTLAPYGGNLEGVRAASLAYFGHEPTSLTDSEQALLIALPQSPEARRPDRRPAAAKRTRTAVLQRLAAAKVITPTAAQEAEGDPIPKRTPFPAIAWQAAGELALRAPEATASVVTTLDARLQSELETLAAATARAQGPDTTAAIMVVEIRGRAVRAAVGSAGRDRPGGWVDATRSLRSPGSALKPFIYAMAFEGGLAAPDSQLQDANTPFAGYAPENFDRVFHGQVTAREALAYSLNVPAVGLLSKVGADAFEARLRATGADIVRPRTGLVDPGLALALGGAGITLRDLAMLYAGLADGGLTRPLAWTEADAGRTEHAAGVRLVRAEAAGQVLDILRESPPPPGRTPPNLIAGAPKLAFKTGTSYGFRDAVAAGVGGGYVVVAWTGRADGGARGGLTGREAALPLLFDVFDALRTEGGAARPLAPKAAPAGIAAAAAREGEGPRLIFPPDGGAVQADGLGPASRGLVLAAEGEGLSWYVDGEPLAPDPVSGKPVWRPAAAGFYSLTVVDAQGRQARARVRVRAD
jgi:penicillin-binding protein 1C